MRCEMPYGDLGMPPIVHPAYQKRLRKAYQRSQMSWRRASLPKFQSDRTRTVALGTTAKAGNGHEATKTEPWQSVGNSYYGGNQTWANGLNRSFFTKGLRCQAK